MTVSAAEEDAATAALWEIGTTGIEVRPAGEDHVALLAYFPDAPDLRATLSRALDSLPAARVQPAEVPDVDWVARFRDGFRAFDAAGFRITPPWEDPSSSTLPVPADVLIVDPGRAFGTGTHESTRLCLGLLRELAGRGPLGRVLDLGTGSGILGIAAAKLGARAVTAVDLDPEAMLSAAQHARLNGVPLRLVRADFASALRPAAFDLVLANIAASVLVERAADILGLGAPAVVLSGLLAADAPAVCHAYSPAGRTEVREDGEWAAVLLHAQQRGSMNI